MRRFGDILRDLGFNPEAPRSTQEAFFRHLLQNANSSSSQNVVPIPKQVAADAQLTFDLEVLGTQTRKRSAP
jgi:hypothetical protein